MATLKSTLIRGREFGRMFAEALRDATHNVRAFAPMESSYVEVATPVASEAQLTKDYHRVEKGLALRSPRRPFGAEVERRLAHGLSLTTDQSPVVQHSVHALEALRVWNAEGVIDDSIAPIGKPEVDASARFSAQQLISSRRSIRNFSDEPIDESLIRRAIELSINAPSVCNRQPWRAYFTTDRSTVADVLSLQNGNAGFRDSVPGLVVVSINSMLFSGAMERNQQWIDGGIFAMTLVLALESCGFSTCMLNCSMRREEMDAVRNRVGFDSSEQVVMMIALGKPGEDVRIARSPRRSVDEVARRINASRS